MSTTAGHSRRTFLTTAAAASTAVAAQALRAEVRGFPSIVPATVLGAQAPSNQITLHVNGRAAAPRIDVS